MTYDMRLMPYKMPFIVNNIITNQGVPPESRESPWSVVKYLDLNI